MTAPSPSITVEALLTFVTEEGRVCPMPQQWNQLWEMLPDRKRVGNGWEPPPPLILAAWHDTPAMAKVLRLREHIEYASSKGVLAEVERFLRALPVTAWLHVEGDAQR
jgi:hypothetical protein